MIRVIDPQVESTVPEPLWRVIGNRPALLDRLAMGQVIGAPIWSSDFSISHRIIEAMSAGHMYFAGDAAQVHSPIGARGMNLGIEDAWVFSHLVQRGEFSRFEQLRYAVDRRVVRHVCIFSRIVACEPTICRALRGVLPQLLRLGLPTPRMMAIITGTDHSLGEFAPSQQPEQ